MADENQAASDDEDMLGQDEIERLLSQAGTGADAVAPKPAPVPAPVSAAPQATATAPSSTPAGGDDSIAQQDIEYLLNQAEEALGSIDDPGGPPPNVTSFRLQEFAGAPASSETATLDLIRDVELDLKIELGRTQMYLEDVLKLRKGAVVPLDKLAGDPVDIYVNGRLIARGEVLVLNDNFCVRVAELIAGANVSV
jgi:flagellar motor switch protein FliN/FliY